MPVSLITETHVVAKDPTKFNNPINTFLISRTLFYTIPNHKLFTNIQNIININLFIIN